MEWSTGQIVSSLTGRDSTRFYVVVGIAKERLLLANGEKWTLENPKTKNIRHVNPSLTILLPSEIQSNQSIKQTLAAYTKASACKQGG